MIYVAVIAQGFRHLVPALGQRLYKLPGLSFLYDYELTYRLDLAIFFAFFMLIAVWFLWARILRLWLEVEHPQDDVFNEHGWNRDNNVRLTLALGFVILGADCCLFFVAITEISWGGSSFSVTALLATGAYLAVLIFVTYVSIALANRMEERKENQ